MIQLYIYIYMYKLDGPNFKYNNMNLEFKKSYEIEFILQKYYT